MPEFSERLGRIEEKLDGLVQDVGPLNATITAHGQMLSALTATNINERMSRLRADVDKLKLDQARREGASKTWLVLWGGVIAVASAAVSIIAKAVGV